MEVNGRDGENTKTYHLPAPLSAEAVRLLSFFTPSEQANLRAFYSYEDHTFIGLGFEKDNEMNFYISEPKASAIAEIEQLYRAELKMWQTKLQQAWIDEQLEKLEPTKELV